MHKYPSKIHPFCFSVMVTLRPVSTDSDSRTVCTLELYFRPSPTGTYCSLAILMSSAMSQKSNYFQQKATKYSRHRRHFGASTKESQTVDWFWENRHYQHTEEPTQALVSASCSHIDCFSLAFSYCLFPIHNLP